LLWIPILRQVDFPFSYDGSWVASQEQSARALIDAKPIDLHCARRRASRPRIRLIVTGRSRLYTTRDRGGIMMAAMICERANTGSGH